VLEHFHLHLGQLLILLRIDFLANIEQMTAIKLAASASSNIGT
jgi:hypothetical protein